MIIVSRCWRFDWELPRQLGHGMDQSEDEEERRRGGCEENKGRRGERAG